MNAIELLKALSGSGPFLWGAIVCFGLIILVMRIIRKRHVIPIAETNRAAPARRIYPWLLSALIIGLFSPGIFLGLRPKTLFTETGSLADGSRRKIDAVFLLDFSGSMQLPQDFGSPQNCIDQKGVIRGDRETGDCLGIIALESLLAKNPGVKVSLVIFGDAFVVGAPTWDHEAIVENAWISLVRFRANLFPSGTNIRIALLEAWTMLKAYDSRNAPIVIASDFSEGEPEKLLETLSVIKREGAKIVPVGIAINDGDLHGVESVLGQGAVQVVREREDIKNIAVSITTSLEEVSTKDFAQPKAGLDRQILSAVTLLTAVLFLTIILVRPIRFVRGWRDV